MPFIDTELAAVVARLPDEFLVGKARGKFVLRAAMRGILPNEILSRKRLGSACQSANGSGPYREFVREALVSEGSQVSRICDGTVVRHLFHRHVEGLANNEKILWSLVNLELFLRAFTPSGIYSDLARIV